MAHVRLASGMMYDQPQRNEWPRPRNLDRFLQNCYKYYSGKGWKTIVLSRLLNLITLAWILVLSFFLLTCVDYRHMFKTNNITDSIHKPEVHWAVWCFVAMYSAFLLWDFVRMAKEFLYDVFEMRLFFANQLEISETELETMQWEEVTAKMAHVHHLSSLTSLHIAARILRRENYLIALFNETTNGSVLLNFTLFGQPFFTHTLEWCLNLALFGQVFDSQNTLKDAYLDQERVPFHAAILRKRLYFLSFLCFLLSPLIFVFLLLYSFFRYAAEVREEPLGLITKQWTRHALYRFREYNELPHYFQHRIALSMKPAQAYFKQFTSSWVASLGRFVAFVAGSIFAVLVVLSFIDDDLVFQGEIGGRNIFGWMAILGAIVAVGRGLVPTKLHTFRPQRYLDGVSEHTHYCPQEWRTGAHKIQVQEEMSSMFEFRIVSFLRELFSVLLAWLMLFWTLPRQAEQLIRFFALYTAHMDGVGHVCSFASFDCRRHRNYNRDGDMLPEGDQPSCDGRLEMSMLSFKRNHPHWAPNPNERIFEDVAQFATTAPGTASLVGAVDPAASVMFASQSHLRPSEIVSKMDDAQLARLFLSYRDSHIPATATASYSGPFSPGASVYPSSASTSTTYHSSSSSSSSAAPTAASSLLATPSASTFHSSASSSRSSHGRSRRSRSPPAITIPLLPMGSPSDTGATSPSSAGEYAPPMLGSREPPKSMIFEDK